jgi:HK97 family phage portal protein
VPRTSWAELRQREERDLAMLRERKAMASAGIEKRGIDFVAGGATMSFGTPYSSWNSGAINLPQAAREGFRASAVVYRAAMTIASAAAKLNLGIGPIEDDSPELDFASLVPYLFNKRPNPAVSAHVFKLTYWLQCEIAGQAFVYADRGPTGEAEPTELWNVFDPVQVVIDNRTDPMKPALLGFRVNVLTGPAVALLPSELLWIRYPDPGDPWGCMSPLRAASWAVDLDNYAKQWQVGEFRNGVKPSGVVYLGDVNEDEFNQLVAEFAAQQSGPANAGKHIFTAGSEPGRYTRIGLTPAEMSFVDSRIRNADEIFLAWGIPSDMWSGNVSFENRRQSKVTLWTETIVPKLEVIESEIDRQLVPDPEMRLAHDTSRVDALQESEDARIRRWGQAFTRGLATREESRERIGLDPVPSDPNQTFAAAGSAGSFGSDVGLAGLSRKPAIERRSRRGEPMTPDEVRTLYDHYEDIGQRFVRRLADKQEKVVQAEAARTRSRRKVESRAAAEDYFDPTYWREVTREMLSEFLHAVWVGGGSRMAKRLGVSFSTFDQHVTAAMRHRLEVLAAQVTDETLAVLRSRILEEGVGEGEGIPKLADRIASVFDDLRGFRAERIARTETVGGFNAASRTAAKNSGLVSRRRWMAAGDDRVRDTHQALDGYETEGLDDRYPNHLMHPGDPGGDAAESINCRCVEEYVLNDEQAPEE